MRLALVELPGKLASPGGARKPPHLGAPLDPGARFARFANRLLALAEEMIRKRGIEHHNLQMMPKRK